MNRRDFRPLPLVIVTVTTLLAGCGQAGSDSKAAAESAAPAPRTYTLQDFRQLRWIEGKWRGQLPNGGWFHEAYHFVDDSTLAMTAYADSTYTKAGTTATISLRGGRVIDKGAGDPPWRATQLDSLGVSFVSDSAPGRHFAWQREPGGRWAAAIFLMHNGHEERTIYSMERAKP